LTGFSNQTWEFGPDGKSTLTLVTQSPGMQVSAEIHLGTRSILDYLLSPVQKAFHEAGRER